MKKVQPQSWLSIGVGRSGVTLAWAFSANERFRVEIYIDTPDARLNRAIFDALAAQCKAIEAKIGHTLHWDPLDGKQACRISYFYPELVSITEDESALEPLIEWAVDATAVMRRAFEPRVKSLPKSSELLRTWHSTPAVRAHE